MFASTALRRFTAWLAACAVLCAGLLPLVSHAVVPQLADGAGLVEVCTVTGMSWVKLDEQVQSDAPGSSQTPLSALTMGSCGWCVTHFPHLGVPPALDAVALPLALHEALPAAWFHAPRPLFAWVAAQPRAPPISA